MSECLLAEIFPVTNIKHVGLLCCLFKPCLYDHDGQKWCLSIAKSWHLLMHVSCQRIHTSLGDLVTLVFVKLLHFLLLLVF